MTAASTLATYSLLFYKNELPEQVKNVAIHAIIDQYGLQIGGSEFPWSKSIYRYITAQGLSADSSTITRFGDNVTPINAAFINGCFAHAQDFDDSHQEAQTHPGSVVIPAAIAVGEQQNQSGENVLKAIIIGMEIMLRLAHSLCPSCIEGGHHTPPTVGPFGAAVACGLLLGLTQEQLTNALGICGSYSGGLVEYTVSGGSVKRIHTGLGARAGLEAALLAKEGLTGPNTIIDGKKGMWTVFGRGKAFKERLLDQIGTKYLLSTLMFKPYNCCYLIHPAIQSFIETCLKYKLTQNVIKSVTVGMSEFSVSHAGTIIIPKDELGAQFSTSFTLALSLIMGPPTLWSYTEATLSNAEILCLANKISVYIDDEANLEFPQNNGCVVHIETISGSHYSSRIRHPKGSPNNLLSNDDVKQKYFMNTVPVIGEVHAKDIYENILNIENLPNIRRFTNTVVVN